METPPTKIFKEKYPALMQYDIKTEIAVLAKPKKILNENGKAIQA